MKHAVSSLEGALLDAAVALAEGWRKSKDDPTAWWPPGKTAIPSSITERGIREGYGFRPSSHWQHGGPIIERERIRLIRGSDKGRPGWWIAYIENDDGVELAQQSGDTALMAAMRAYVASKLGDEVEML